LHQSLKREATGLAPWCVTEYNNDNIIFSFYKDDKNLSKEQLDYLNSIIDKNNKKIKFEKKMRKYFFIKDFFFK